MSMLDRFEQMISEHNEKLKSELYQSHQILETNIHNAISLIEEAESAMSDFGIDQALSQLQKAKNALHRIR